MRRLIRRVLVALALVPVSLAIPTPVAAKVKVTLCGPGCICIDYDKGSSSHIEVRCTGGGGGGGGAGGGGGWTTIPPEPNDPAPDGPGSFGGDGDPGAPVDPHPCNPVTGALSQKLTQAKAWANSHLSWIGPPENRQPTTCTHLFRNSPLHLSGKSLLDGAAPFHAIFRNGQNCTLHNGEPSPCSSSTAAVATCCEHSPYVYLCDSFAGLSQSDAGIRLLHELLHVAGQKEDSTPTTGPGDPPTTNQLNDLVREACLNPQVIGDP